MEKNELDSCEMSISHESPDNGVADQKLVFGYVYAAVVYANVVGWQ
jgi:hypothetical protein